MTTPVFGILIVEKSLFLQWKELVKQKKI